MICASSCIIGLLRSDVVCYCIPISITSCLSIYLKALYCSFHRWDWNCYFRGVMEFIGSFQSYFYFSVIDSHGFILKCKYSLLHQAFSFSSIHQARLPVFPRFLVTLVGTNRKADIDFSRSAISISMGSLLVCV